MEPKFKVGQRIKVWSEEYKEYSEGHITLIMNPFQVDERIYYCSMYPGAQANYEYVHCVDLNGCGLDNNGRVETLQALNKFTENQLELVE